MTPALDPILSDLYFSQSSADKVDLGVGVFIKTALAKPLIMAEECRNNQRCGPAGCEEFNQGMIDLLLSGTAAERVAAIQVSKWGVNEAIYSKVSQILAFGCPLCQSQTSNGSGRLEG